MPSKTAIRQFTEEELCKNLAGIPDSILIKILALAASDRRCGEFCITSFRVNPQTGNVNGFRATAQNRNRQAGIAPGDEVYFDELSIPAGLSDEIKAAKREGFKVCICWRGDPPSGQDAVIFGSIVEWEEKGSCKQASDGSLLVECPECIHTGTNDV